MKILGCRPGEYWKLTSPLFIIIAVVWALRLTLHLLDAPSWLVRVMSVNGASSLAAVIAVLLIHVRRFGSYHHVFIVTFLLVAFRELLIVGAILFTVATGIETIFSAPEFSIQSEDPYHFRHIVGHLTVGLASGTLLGGAMGCLLFYLLRKLVPPRPVR